MRVAPDYVPSYRLHKASGQAIVTLNGHDHLLGPFGSPESRVRYHELIGEWERRGRKPVEPPPTRQPESTQLRVWLPTITPPRRRTSGVTVVTPRPAD
jgi:hypothetical protein